MDSDYPIGISILFLLFILYINITKMKYNKYYNVGQFENPFGKL